MPIPMGITMLINIRVEDHLDSLNRPLHREILCMRCDTCGKEWEMRGSKSRVMSRKTHSCSAQCKSDAHKNGGVVERLRAKSCVEKYGTENPFASEICKEKIRKTNLEKFGNKHARSTDLIKEKVSSTMMLRYGVSNATQSLELREKQLETMVSRYGVKYPMQLESVRESLRQGSIKKWGVPYMMQNSEQRKSIFEKRDKNAWMSKIEKRFRVVLEERYGKDDVKVQQLIERTWCVDFYIISKNLWISFDGVYWHGLDRPIEMIRGSSKGHDIAIYHRWSKDRQLDSYVKENNIKLVRITDTEFKNDPESCLRKIEEN